MFGWNINSEFDHQPTFFGTRGFLGVGEQPNELIPWLGDELGLTTLGVLAYGGASAAQSEACKGDIEAGIEQFDSGVELGFEDSSLQFGFSDVSPQVQQMVDAGVDFVATCMDFNGHTTLARELLRQEVVATHWLPQAYDHEFLADFGDLFEGSHVFLASLSRARAPAPGNGRVRGVDGRTRPRRRGHERAGAGGGSRRTCSSPAYGSRARSSPVRPWSAG